MPAGRTQRVTSSGLHGDRAVALKTPPSLAVALLQQPRDHAEHEGLQLELEDPEQLQHAPARAGNRRLVW